MAKKSKMDRGLDSLFFDNSIDEITRSDSESVKNDDGENGISTVRISLIEPDKNQPRSEFDEDALNELAENIRQHGVLQPILVRPLDNGGYKIVAGERRWRAARLAGLDEIPVYIKELTDLEAAEISLIENIQRKDLTPLEEAAAYQTLMETYGLTQQKVAEAVGRSRSAVANSIRLLSLSENVQEMLRDKKRAALVFMSLFMGITMILGVNGVISSMSAENFIKEYMDYNFEYTDIQFEQYEQLNKEVPQFDEHFVEQIKQLDGIKNIDVQKTVWAGIDFNENDLEGFMKIKYEDSKYKAKGQSYEQTIETLKGYAESGDYGCYITTLPDDRVLEEYNAEHPDTPIDMEAFKRGETAIAGKDTEYNAPNTALVGETLTLTADSTDGKATDFKIGGAFYYDDYDNTLSEGIGRRKEINMVPDVIFVSEAGMERLTKEPIISAIGVDIKNFNDLERIDSELQAINSTLTTSEWQLKSSVNQKELYNQMNYSLSLLGNGAAILLIVIGLINFVNVMLTGVVARKNEFAIMESIGTTKKQIRKILTLEGGIYALISTLLIMTFGNAFLMLVADAVPHMANYAVFKYPVALVIGLIAAIFVICLSVPAIVYKATSDETVIERLHNFDS